MYNNIKDFQDYIFANITEWSELGFPKEVSHIIDYISITIKPVNTIDLKVFGSLHIKHTYDINDILILFIKKLNVKQVKITSIISAKCSYNNTIRLVKRTVCKNAAYLYDLQYELLFATTKSNGHQIDYIQRPQIKYSSKSNNIRYYTISYVSKNGFVKMKDFNFISFWFDTSCKIIRKSTLITLKPGINDMLIQNQQPHSISGPAIIELTEETIKKQYCINNKFLNKQEWSNNKAVKLYKLKFLF